MTNFITQKDDLNPKTLQACRKIIQLKKTPCFIFIVNTNDSMINWQIYEAINANKGKIGTGKELSIIIFSYGGVMHSAYKIMKLLRKRYSKITAFIPNQAKSASTLMCLGADEIIMAESAELGPLDTQHRSPIDPDRPISALESFKALDAIKKFASETFDWSMFHFLARSSLTMVEAFPHVTKFVGTIIEPLFGSFDIHRLGDYGRSLEIAQDYGLRLMKYSYKNKTALQKNDILRQLIWNYPSHGQVIDIDECREIGLNAREANDQEEIILQEIAINIDNTLYTGMVIDEKKQTQSKKSTKAHKKN